MPPKASLQTRKKIYQSLCYVLSDRANQVAWDDYSPADWDLFAQMADREGVAPLMYWKLKDSPVAVPPSTFNFLRSTYYQTLAQNTLMYQELGRILKALDEAGIPVIVLKGAALAATVYEDIGLRPMGDLDLLVRREQIHRIEPVFERLGYGKQSTPKISTRLNRLTGYDVRYLNKFRQDMIVEVHWNLIAGDVDWRSPSLEWFWQQVGDKSKELRLPKMARISKGKIFYRGAQLLHLSAHLMLKHGGRETRLLWLFDIHSLFSSSETLFGWDEIIAAANKFRWAPALYNTFLLLKELFNTSIPQNVLDELSNVRSIQSDRLIKAKSFPLRTRTIRDLNKLYSLTWFPRLGLLFFILFPSPAFMRWRYDPKPDWTWPLFYIYRWVDILGDILYTIYRMHR
jgi:hypothetical protein